MHKTEKRFYIKTHFFFYYKWIDLHYLACFCLNKCLLKPYSLVYRYNYNELIKSCIKMYIYDK